MATSRSTSCDRWAAPMPRIEVRVWQAADIIGGSFLTLTCMHVG
jgi:hypothetical protein